ncbi:MAG TPA: M14 family metallopeptidase [Amycolatopsis sp.]|uniref:M14 family metallopeptidase n=1 Tax=Amycolatopsis sp. TaxID=37632 RepID=UPI002B4AA4ED|nr:M14 family metallopeptidase [Amycolatopsis sp.]HKS46626.1 M14 family metallopeptidase [Amycolatopsis sp.]
MAPAASAAANDFPSGYQGYHTYAEVTAELQKAVANHPDIAKLSSVGKSYEGRNLNLLTIGSGTGKPEVLFTCNQHAREHLTTEMCLHIVQRFTDGYATDSKIKNMVDTHTIYVVPNVNPDGSEYDISGGRFHNWRKTRKPVPGSTAIGTDPNRNWDYQWGCCDGSSTNPSAQDYRGTAPFSEPETRALADFINAHQVKAHIDFHTYSELVLWPFGYTTSPTATGMTAAEAKRFQDLGKAMAATNGYTPEQSSKLYITDGDINDWSWGTHKILSFCFEMYPTGSNPGFYPKDTQIVPQTTRNDPAVDLLIGQV